MALLQPQYADRDSLSNMAMQAAFYRIIAMGTVFVLLRGSSHLDSTPIDLLLGHRLGSGLPIDCKPPSTRSERASTSELLHATRACLHREPLFAPARGQDQSIEHLQTRARRLPPHSPAAANDLLRPIERAANLTTGLSLDVVAVEPASASLAVRR